MRLVPSDCVWIDAATAGALPTVSISLAEEPDACDATPRRQDICEERSRGTGHPSLERTDVHENRLKPVVGNSARDWLQLGAVAASAVRLALAVTLAQSASGAAMPTFTFDDLLLWSEGRTGNQ